MFSTLLMRALKHLHTYCTQNNLQMVIWSWLPYLLPQSVGVIDILWPSTSNAPPSLSHVYRGTGLPVMSHSQLNFSSTCLTLAGRGLSNCMLAEIAADNYITLHILHTFITYYITLHCDILNNDTHSILVLLFFFFQILFHCCKHIGAPKQKWANNRCQNHCGSDTKFANKRYTVWSKLCSPGGNRLKSDTSKQI